MNRAISILLLFVVAFVWAGLSSCMCGHYNLLTIWVVGPIQVFAIITYLKGPKFDVGSMIVASISLVLLCLLTSKALVDIFWNGHDALLR